MIGALAEIAEPERFSQLVMVGPSPRYINDDGYVGGFGEEDISELLESLGSNYLGWSSVMAPVIVGNPDRPQLGHELTESFCRMDPEVARRFARTTFLSDSREDLPRISTPTLVLQCREDAIAPREVGEYVASTIPDASLVVLDATGHCPNLSAPEETISAIRDFVEQHPERVGTTSVTERVAAAAFHDALLEDDPVLLYEQAPCGYLSTTPDGIIVKANQTFLTWLGYDADDVVGRSFAEPDDRRRPDLPRDPLRPAAADAGPRPRDRGGPDPRPTTAGSRCCSTRPSATA